MEQPPTRPREPLPPTAPPPLPGPPLVEQSWHDVVLTHWAIPPRQAAPLLPPGTRPDVLNGTTYVGLVAFRIPTTTAAKIPVGGFNEANVRLYSIDAHGRQGVVFLSMDADSAHNALAARALLGLPYMWSDVSLRHHGGVHAGAVRRRLPQSTAHGRWRTTVGEPAARPSPLERFVTARWGLHTHHAGHTWWIRVHHRPWPLYRAHSWTYQGNLLRTAGLDVGGRAPVSVLWSPGVDSGIRPTTPTAHRT